MDTSVRGNSFGSWTGEAMKTVLSHDTALGHGHRGMWTQHWVMDIALGWGHVGSGHSIWS